VSPITGTKVDLLLLHPARPLHPDAAAAPSSSRCRCSARSRSACRGADCPGTGPAKLGDPGGARGDVELRALALWHQIYDPTAFLVGLSDDYTGGGGGGRQEGRALGDERRGRASSPRGRCDRPRGPRSASWGRGSSPTSSTRPARLPARGDVRNPRLAPSAVVASRPSGRRSRIGDGEGGGGVCHEP
jgi:hypothetical protein